MEGSVRKRGNNWYYRLDLAYKNGERTQIERYAGKSKEEALSTMRKAIREYESTGEVTVDSNISVHDYFEYWFKNYVLVELKLNTQKNYRMILDNHIYPTLGNYKLKSIKTSTIQTLLNEKFESGYAKQTVGIVKGVLNKGFSMAVYPYEFIQIDPTRYARIPRYDEKEWRDRGDLKIISMNDFKKILSVVHQSDSYYLPMMISFQSGLRRAEVCGLKWEDVDFEQKTITVERIMINDKKDFVLGTPKTKSSYRTIEIGNSLLTLLKSHRKRQKENKLFYGQRYFDSDFVCTKENGQPVTPNSIKWSTQKFRKLSGVEFNFHSFRHTYATMLIENGAKMKEVQRRLGHSRMATTSDTYAHVTKKMQTESVDIFENLLYKNNI
jgi:ATP-dependent helicase/nuclease subunit A